MHLFYGFTSVYRGTNLDIFRTIHGEFVFVCSFYSLYKEGSKLLQPLDITKPTKKT